MALAADVDVKSATPLAEALHKEFPGISIRHASALGQIGEGVRVLQKVWPWIQVEDGMVVENILKRSAKKILASQVPHDEWFRWYRKVVQSGATPSRRH